MQELHCSAMQRTANPAGCFCFVLFCFFNSLTFVFEIKTLIFFSLVYAPASATFPKQQQSKFDHILTS
jgi:hypothetical protein